MQFCKLDAAAIFIKIIRSAILFSLLLLLRLRGVEQKQTGDHALFIYWQEDSECCTLVRCTLDSYLTFVLFHNLVNH